MMYFIHNILTKTLRPHTGHLQGDVLIKAYKNINAISLLTATP